VLDRYVEEISIREVEEGGAWKETDALPELSGKE